MTHTTLAELIEARRRDVPSADEKAARDWTWQYDWWQAGMWVIRDRNRPEYRTGPMSQEDAEADAARWPGDYYAEPIGRPILAVSGDTLPAAADLAARLAERDHTLTSVPSCSWHGHGAYPETCWWCALNRVVLDGQAPTTKETTPGCVTGVEGGCYSYRCGSDCTNKYDRMHPCPACIGRDPLDGLAPTQATEEEA